MEYIWLIVGFVLLIKGADFFVDGSSAVAKMFKVPSIIIGLTVVALGTSLPEAAVSISASVTGANSLAVSNVVGSNLFNLLVVLGASALVLPVATKKDTVTKEIPFSIAVTVVLLAWLLIGVKITEPEIAIPELDFWDKLRDASFTLGRAAGIVLLALLVFFMWWQISGALKARKRNGDVDEDTGDQKKPSVIKAIIFIVFGAAGIVVGGDLVVDSAKTIAANFGMSEELIGLTIVALGTSLPELVTSMVAAKKGESDLALGNVIGSSIFNIIFILCMSALISPMTVGINTIFDIVFLIAISLVVWLFAKTKQKVSRPEGATLILMYIAYFVYIIIRDTAK